MNSQTEAFPSSPSANSYNPMMYNSMVNQMRNSQMFMGGQPDMSQGGMPMMMPYSYNPYMHNSMMPSSFASQMVKVEEAKEDEDEEGEFSVNPKRNSNGVNKPKTNTSFGREIVIDQK
jgi:hypothetical protein